MKGIIYYYSGSGNTELACRYIAKKIKTIEFDFCDITKKQNVGLEKYNIVGFATFTDFYGVPYLFNTFIDSLQNKCEKYAFIFNTYGGISGKTLKNLEGIVKLKSFNIIAGYSLHTPESYPPAYKRGWGFEKAPSEKKKNDFDNFISKLDRLLDDIKNGNAVKKIRIKHGLASYIMPSYARTTARKDMGEKYIDENLCNECGICEKGCPYNAISMNSKPLFDMIKCYGCWRCYNKCPKKAIYTKKIKGIGYYPKPNNQLIEKLKT